MSDWHQMDAFIAVTHGVTHPLRNRQLFDWFFLRGKDKKSANLIVAYEGDKLISLLGYIPTRFLWGRDVVDGSWMAHWVTLDGYRSGIGALLMKKITEMFPVVAGQGASQMNREIVTKMKFKFLEKIPKMVYIFNSEKIENFFNFKSNIKTTSEREKLGCAVETSKVSVENFNPNWAYYPSLHYGTLRDSEYLEGRYINYPFFKYCVFLEGDASSPCLLVARIVDTAAGIRVARILELFFPEHDIGRTQCLLLVKKCLNFFDKQKCDYADFYGNSNECLQLLQKAGFIPEDSGALPSLLDPIDFTRKFQNLELFVSPLLKERHPNCEAQFVVTRADGDQDRPNESFRTVF